MNDRRRRGIALVLTMLVSSLLMLLAGAFVTVNRTNVSIMGGSDAHIKALEAAQAGVDYCRMKMEMAPDWGNGGVNDSDSQTVSVPGFVTHEKKWQDGGLPPNFWTHQVVGVMNGGDAHFQIIFRSSGAPSVDIAGAAFSDDSIDRDPTGGMAAWTAADLRKEDISTNYLSSISSDPPLLAPVLTQGRTIPPQGCKIIVMGYAHGARRRIDTSFGKNLITNSAAASGGKMALIPDPGGKWYAGSTNPAKNQIQSTGDTLLGGPDPSNPALAFFQFWGSSNNMGTARAGGQIIQDANPSYTYDGADDVQATSSQSPLSSSQLNTAGAAAKGTLLSGVASTGVRTINSADIEGLSISATTTPTTLPGGTYTVVSGDKALMPGDSTPRHTLDAAGKVTVDNGKIVVHGDTKVTFSGTTNITASSTSGITPGLAIGYSNGYNLDSKTSVVHVDGSLSVNGTIAGQGSLATVGKNGGGSEDGGRLYIQGKSDLSADPDVGVAVYANQTVAISKPSGGTIKAADFTVFQAPLQQVPASSSEWGSNGNNLGNWSNLNSNQRQSRVGPPANPDSGPVLAPSAYIGGSASANNQGPVDLRHADISNSLGRINDSTSAANMLLNDASFHEITRPAASGGKGAQVIASYQAMLDAFNNTNGTAGTPTAINGTNNEITVPADAGGLSLGRYVRLREFLADNERWLESGAGVAGELSPTSLPWADLTDTTTNGAVNEMVKQQYNFYASQLGVNTGSYTTLKDLYYNGNYATITYDAFNANFKGLIYTNKNIYVNLSGGSFQLQGAFISQENTVMRRLHNIVTVYDSTLLDKLTQNMNSGGGIELSVTYWSSN